MFAAEQANPAELRALLVGTWDWGGTDKPCKENPHSIEFAADGSALIVRHPKGAALGSKVLHKELVYKILDEGPNFLRMRIEGEDRKTEEGKPVVWDIVLLERDKYCWCRTDLPDNACSKAVLRCSDAVRE